MAQHIFHFYSTGYRVSRELGSIVGYKEIDDTSTEITFHTGETIHVMASFDEVHELVTKNREQTRNEDND